MSKKKQKQKSKLFRLSLTSFLIFLFSIISVIIIPHILKNDEVIAQTNVPVGDGTYYYWDSQYSLGINDGVTVSFYWITDLDGNPISGAGYWEYSVFGNTIGSGYMDMGTIMNLNGISLETYELIILLGILQGT